MSMYWSGDMLLGCIIQGDDIDYFKREYIKLNPEEFENVEPEVIEDQLNEWLTCNEAFNYADGDLKKTFSAQLYTEDNYEGLYFISACPGTNINEQLEWRKPVIFVSAEKSIYSRGVLNGNFYHSYQELEDEFKEKIGKYLPKDFEWKSAIGDLSFVCFS